MVEIQGFDGLIDPLNTANYVVDCGDAVESLVIGFTNFTGPRQVRTVLDYHPGGVTQAWTRRIPAGKVDCEPITISKGIVPVDQLDNLRAWYAQAAAPGKDGKGFQQYHFRRAIKLMAKDNTGVVQRTITLFNAWPSAYKPLSDFDGANPSIVMCELTIEWEGWDLGTAVGAPAVPFAVPT